MEFGTYKDPSVLRTSPRWGEPGKSEFGNKLGLWNLEKNPLSFGHLPKGRSQKVRIRKQIGFLKPETYTTYDTNYQSATDQSDFSN